MAGWNLTYLYFPEKFKFIHFLEKNRVSELTNYVFYFSPNYFYRTATLTYNYVDLVY